LYISRYNHAGADDFEVSRLLIHTQNTWQTAMDRPDFVPYVSGSFPAKAEVPSSNRLLHAMPLIIWKRDFVPDTSNWANRSFARYFGHTTIGVKEVSAHI
jgi:hypothetical protein